MTTPALDDLTTLFTAGRTPRGFLDTPVDDVEILAAYDTAKWGPTAFNGQPMRLVMVNSQAARGELLPLVSEGNRARVASAPQVALVAADTNFHNTFERVSPGMAGNAMFDDAERRTALATSQAWLQLGYFIVALRARGLAVGPMTGFNRQAVTETMLAGTGLETIALLAIGHEDTSAQRDRQDRLDADDVISWR